MTPLERELQGFARPSTGRTLPTCRRPSRRSSPTRGRSARRAVGASSLALAVVLAALLAVLAVPPARTAIFDWLGIGSARSSASTSCRRSRRHRASRSSASASTLDEARLRAGFPFADPPDDERAPDQIRVAPGMRVTYVWRDGDRVRLLVTQFPGDATDPGLIKKFVASGTRIDLVYDRRLPCALARGRAARRPVRRPGRRRARRPRLARREHAPRRADGSTLRIEAQIDRDDAIEPAARPPRLIANPSNEGSIPRSRGVPRSSESHP